MLRATAILAVFLHGQDARATSTPPHDPPLPFPAPSLPREQLSLGKLVRSRKRLFGRVSEGEGFMPTERLVRDTPKGVLGKRSLKGIE